MIATLPNYLKNEMIFKFMCNFQKNKIIKMFVQEYFNYRLNAIEKTDKYLAFRMFI